MANKKDTEFLNPYIVVKDLELKRGMSVADFGSGAGHWALAIAAIVGNEGKVYAIDIRRSVLEVLEGHIKLDGFFQISTIQADLERDNSTNLNNESQDAVFCSNILHQLENIENIFAEARRILKNNGRLIVVDWAKNSVLGPKNRISKKEVEKRVEESGFKLKRDLNTGHAHYGLIFSK